MNGCADLCATGGDSVREQLLLSSADCWIGGVGKVAASATSYFVDDAAYACLPWDVLEERP